MKYRKKPVVIDAWQWDGDAAQAIARSLGSARQISVVGDSMFIETREGTMEASKGDWIITGVQGEMYPCKPDIFELTYEHAHEWVDYPESDAYAFRCDGCGDRSNDR